MTKIKTLEDQISILKEEALKYQNENKKQSTTFNYKDISEQDNQKDSSSSTWKAKFDNLNNNFDSKIKVIKQESKDEKLLILSNINKIKAQCEAQISEVKNQYESLFLSYQNQNEKLLKENAELKKKIHKISGILIK